MTTDGKSLEALVQFVEEQHLPPGFTIKARERVYEDGVQVAEFDIHIQGKLGTTEISWLIECRDRPSEGPQGGEWIDGLFGRRAYFGANKITAVSTTGFTQGARNRAERGNIELREIQSLRPESFENWLQVKALTLTRPHAHLHRMIVHGMPDETPKRLAALTDRLIKHKLEQPPPPILKSSKNGALLYPHQAFGFLVDANPALRDGLTPGGPPRRIQGTIAYKDDDHFLVETDLGDVRVQGFEIDGEVSIVEVEHPLVATKQYQRQDKTISEFAAFEPVDLGERSFSLELHRMAESGETFVVGRVEPKKAVKKAE